MIGPESTTLLWAVIMGLAGFGFWAEQNTRIGRLPTGIEQPYNPFFQPGHHENLSDLDSA